MDEVLDRSGVFDQCVTSAFWILDVVSLYGKLEVNTAGRNVRLRNKAFSLILSRSISIHVGVVWRRYIGM